MSASPTATPVTTPALVTVATDAIDEDQAACVVTVCVVPFGERGDREKLGGRAHGGAVPLTATEDTKTEGPVPGEPPHAVSVTAMQATLAPRRRSESTRVTCFNESDIRAPDRSNPSRRAGGAGQMR